MSVFTMRDGSEIDSDQLSDVEANADRDELSDVEANVRELVRRDDANLRREPESETDVVNRQHRLAAAASVGKLGAGNRPADRRAAGVA